MPPGADVIDPAATHAPPQPSNEEELAALDREFETEPASEHPDWPPAGEDEEGPPTFTLALDFESGAELGDAQAVWRRANELIESAAAKGLRLIGGEVSQAPGDVPRQVVMEQALAELAELERAQRAASE